MNQIQFPISRGLLLMAAYVVTGKLGLMLALPPGYVSAIFPPAGLAVAASYIAGWSVLPWVFLGSLLLNLMVGSFEFSIVSTASAFFIALASTTQAALGGWLLKRLIGHSSLLDNGEHIGRYLVAAPAVCLVSSTLSVSSLWALKVIDGEAWLNSWFTWWTGDSLGVFVVFPLILLLYGKPVEIWRKRRISVGIPVIIAFILVTFGYIQSSKSEEAEILQSFRLHSQQFADLIQTRFDEQEYLLEQLDAFLSLQNTKPASRQDFKNFVHQSLSRFPVIQAIEWAPKIEANQRLAFVREQQAELPGFDIRERNAEGSMVSASTRSSYFPVTYVEPPEGNETALGFDLASNPARNKAVIQAMTTGGPVATAPLHLVQEESNQAGILLLTKVSSGSNAPGLVLTVLRVGDFLEKSFSRKEDMSIRLSDALENKVLYNTPEWTDSTLIYERTLKYGGRQYHLQVQPTSAYLTRHKGMQSWWFLATGLLATGMLGGMMLLVTGYTARIEATVKERTFELTQERDRSQMLQHEAEEASQAKSQFLSSMSHELRTPLNAIIGFSKLIEIEAKGDLLKNNIQEVISAAHHLLGLVNEVLDLAKIESGSVKLSISSYKLGDLLSQCVTTIKPVADHENVKIENNINTLAKINIDVDKKRFTQIMLNLLSNAIKYNNQNGKVIIDCMPAGAQMIRVSVTDTGEGLTPEQTDILFNTFERLGAESSLIEGTGLGLVISKDLIELMGGTIGVESAIGKGSNFWIQVPLSES